jgi:TRAP-type C4-dicarboxylate transport system permease small subunit
MTPSVVAGLLLRGLDRIAAVLVVLAMAGMVVIVSAQVGLRYGLNQSFDWADEVSRLLFVWSVFLAIPLGIARGGHIGIDLLPDRLPVGARRRLLALVDLASAALMAAVAWYAGLQVREQWDEPMSTLDLSVGLFMLPIAVGAAHSALHLIRQAVVGRLPRRAVIPE